MQMMLDGLLAASVQGYCTCKTSGDWIFIS